MSWSIGTQINFASASPFKPGAVNFWRRSGPASVAALAVTSASGNSVPTFCAANATARRAVTPGAASKAARFGVPRVAACSGSGTNWLPMLTSSPLRVVCEITVASKTGMLSTCCCHTAVFIPLCGVT